MPESTGIHNKRDGVIAFADSGAQTYTVAYEPGDFSLEIPSTTVGLYLDRGVIGSTPSIRLEDDQPMTLSFSAYLRDVGDTADTYATLGDVARPKSGRYVDSNWTSTLTNSDVTTWTTTYTIDGTFKGEADKTLTFPYCWFTSYSVAEGTPSTESVSLTSYALLPTLS